MKRYIKLDSQTDFIRKHQNRPDGGYLYILKHGIGPGTLPKDVEIIRTEDLPNYYTAVWLDRFLTATELKQYDIPSETTVRSRLMTLGYTLDEYNDIVPIESSTQVNASTAMSGYANKYDTKIIAKWLKAKFDDEAFGTSYTTHRISDSDAYMARNRLTYNRKNKTIDLIGRAGEEGTPIFKVIPQYSSTKKNGTYAPKLPKLVPIDEWAPAEYL